MSKKKDKIITTTTKQARREALQCRDQERNLWMTAYLRKGAILEADAAVEAFRKKFK